jgi:hypothetical protein
LPRGEDEGNPVGDQPSGRERERLRGCTIEPLRIVDDRQQRAFLGGLREEAQGRQTDEEGVRSGAHPEPERDRQGLVLRRRQAVREGKNRREQLLKRSEGELDLPFHANRPQDPEPLRRLDRVFEQLGLAHAGLAKDHERPAVPASGGFEEPVECLSLALPAQ